MIYCNLSGGDLDGSNATGRPTPSVRTGRRQLVPGRAIGAVISLAGLLLVGCGGQPPAPIAMATVTTTIAANPPATATSAHPPTATAPSNTATPLPQTVTALPPTATIPPSTVAVSAPPIQSTPATVLYAADFASWFSGAETEPFPFRASLNPATGEYHLALTDPARTYGYVRYAPEQRGFTDFRLEVTARRIAGPDNGGSYGVVFRAQAQGADGQIAARYLFLIQPAEGTFALNLIDASGHATSVAPRTASAAIGRGNAINHLTVVCRTDRITLAINGQTVGTYRATVSGAGAIGVTVANPANAAGPMGMEAAFGELRVSAVTDAP